MNKTFFDFTKRTFLLLGLIFHGSFVADSLAQTNPYAPERTKADKPAKESKRSTVERDTVPRYGKGRVDLRAAIVFPVQYFGQAEPGNPDAGYAAQGFGFGMGRFLPFRRESPIGAYFALGYSYSDATAMIPQIQSLLDRYAEAEGGEPLSLQQDERPRYQMIPASLGLAFESNGSHASVYARFLLHLVWIGMNEFNVRGEELGRRTVEIDSEFSSGFGLEFGARFSEVLRVGVGWQYFGRPEFSYVTNSSRLPSSIFSPLTTGRPVSVLAVNLGYSFDRSAKRRKGARIR
ncbi:MAG: hypothetical protein ABR572_12215 [Cryomorphaceae bacterium]